MANTVCGEPVKTSFEGTPDVDDIATVAEEAPVGLPANTP
jgi:hypothetical protein